MNNSPKNSGNKLSAGKVNTNWDGLPAIALLILMFVAIISGLSYLVIKDKA